MGRHLVVMSFFKLNERWNALWLSMELYGLEEVYIWKGRGLDWTGRDMD